MVLTVFDIPKFEARMISDVKDSAVEAAVSSPIVVFVLKSVKLRPPCTDSISKTTDQSLVRGKEHCCGRQASVRPQPPSPLKMAIGKLVRFRWKFVGYSARKYIGTNNPVKCPRMYAQYN